MADERVRVYWYEHDCEWITKYCEEEHLVSMLLPKNFLTMIAEEARNA